MLLGVRYVMKKWSRTHLQRIGVPCCQRSPTTLDVVTKKNSTDMLFMSTKPAAQKKLGLILLISACSGQNHRFWAA
jgi:hypothetical protein